MFWQYNFQFTFQSLCLFEFVSRMYYSEINLRTGPCLNTWEVLKDCAVLLSFCPVCEHSLLWVSPNLCWFTHRITVPTFSNSFLSRIPSAVFNLYRPHLLFFFFRNMGFLSIVGWIVSLPSHRHLWIESLKM